MFSLPVLSNRLLLNETIKGTLSRIDMRSSIRSLRDLSRSTAIMEISMS